MALRWISSAGGSTTADEAQPAPHPQVIPPAPQEQAQATWEYLKRRLKELGLVNGSVYRTKVDCLRVCRCDAVGGFTFDEKDKRKSPAASIDEADPGQCWIYIDKCCACGRAST